MCQRSEIRRRNRVRCQLRERKRGDRVDHEMTEAEVCFERRGFGSRRAHRSRGAMGKEQEEVPKEEEREPPSCLLMLTEHLGSSIVVRVGDSRRKAETESEGGEQSNPILSILDHPHSVTSSLFSLERRRWVIQWIGMLEMRSVML